MVTTTIHLSDSLLDAIDREAKAKGMSRNRLIVLSIEKYVREELSWSAALLADLKRPLPKADVEAIDEIMRDIQQARRSKGPPNL